MPHDSARLGVSELAALIGRPNAPVILDASWHMPATGRKGDREFAERHLPGARFFDIDGIRDAESPYPHMLSLPEDFARSLGALGVRETDAVVVYDAAGMFSAPRAWWMLRVMGHRGPVWVLDGGLPAWVQAGHAVESGAIAAAAVVDYHAQPQPSLLADWRMLRDHADASTILDARSAARFAGAEAEPRPGVRAGHIPGSRNLHYAKLIDENGHLLPTESLRHIFADLTSGSVIATCGSGVTACILALGLHEIGHGDVRVYDGSWSEWGARHDLPLATGTE